jgi:predicted Fe-Mo cluster-binding NifX family protein
MSVVVTADGPNLDSKVDPRFGRCAYFVIVDIETMEARGVPNDAKEAMGGAGIQAAQIVDELGGEVVLTGDVGPSAFSALKAAGIDIYIGLTGTVRDAVEKFKNGEAEKALSSTTAPKHVFGSGAAGARVVRNDVNRKSGRGRGKGSGGGGRSGGRGRGRR